MPIPLLAAAGMVALRALPMVASAVGRGAAAGAARAGASEAVSAQFGRMAQTQTMVQTGKMMERHRSRGGEPAQESRQESFRGDSGPF